MIFDFFRRRAAAKDLALIKQGMPERQRQCLDAAFSGDESAAQATAIFAPPTLIGKILVAAYRLKMPNPAYRAFVNDVWSMNYDAVIHVCKRDRTLVRSIIQSAQFDCSNLPETFPIYRGVKNYNDRGWPGLSWTTNRDAACWFATIFSLQPAVLKAEAQRSEVIFHSNDRNEHEVVLSCDKPFIIDGEISEWRAATSRHMESLAEHNEILRSKV